MKRFLSKKQHLGRRQQVYRCIGGHRCWLQGENLQNFRLQHKEQERGLVCRLARGLSRDYYCSNSVDFSVAAGYDHHQNGAKNVKMSLFEEKKKRRRKVQTSRSRVSTKSKSGSDMQAILDARREKFVLSAEEVKDLMQAGHFEDETHLLRELTGHTGNLSIPPISNFRVSSAALGESGRIYVGVNIEFEGLPLPYSIHAEQFLILNALQHGEKHLQTMYISHVPCGHCRQFMCELVKSEDMGIHIVGKEGKRFTVPELLPMRFTPRDLIGDSAIFLFDEVDNNLVWTSESKDLLNEASTTDTFRAMAKESLVEANSSYAPYSNCPSGVCILDVHGNLYSGSLIESAAYNPSVSPLHSALVNGLIKGGLEKWEEIEHVMLVEPADASVKHEHVLKEVLKFISLEAQYTVLYCTTNKEE